jgi:ActR/RegA family two-component response regulator
MVKGKGIILPHTIAVEVDLLKTQEGMNMVNLLLVDDEKPFVEAVAERLRAKGFDARGTVRKVFREVKKVNFQFYLIFVLEDGKVMVKRPANKKEAFRVDRGLFPIS